MIIYIAGNLRESLEIPISQCNYFLEHIIYDMIKNLDEKHNAFINKSVKFYIFNSNMSTLQGTVQYLPISSQVVAEKPVYFPGFNNCQFNISSTS